VAGHAGGGVGYSTSLLFDIERGDAVAVLTNRRGLSVEPLAWELLDAVD
jgi:hypothetical protein